MNPIMSITGFFGLTLALGPTGCGGAAEPEAPRASRAATTAATPAPVAEDEGASEPISVRPAEFRFASRRPICRRTGASTRTP